MTMQQSMVFKFHQTKPKLPLNSWRPALF